MDFRIRQLQCFLTLSDLLNYGKTARALYMSQPTISFQIKSLEEAFNIKLFERDRQQVRLTDAGYAFREYAQNIMDTVDAAQECLTGLHTRLRLRASFGPVGQFVLLPAVIRMLAAQYPNFELDVAELTTEQQMARIAEGKIDALLMVGAMPVTGLRFDPICTEPLIAFVSCQSHLASQRSISVQELRNVSIIASREKDCRFHKPFLHNLLAPFGITPRIVESPQSCAVQFAYAASGEGIAITTSSMAACTFPGVVAVPFKESLPPMQLGLASMQANETRAMTIFRKVVMECAEAALERSVQATSRPQHGPEAVKHFPNHREAS
ncbi:LysR family transcriptional regulator [Granulicella arctica]|uniref:DNA-binding transcriptional LysR family regulator n=1 Tax=Granulicella arctica TaxID=940613 RepID=A0A7Y9TGS5_9BACT|nr:LysR family transcriptional regulator [Granulicella arctica]NYF80246.1 DNA-binding transcriptional LysR family regulator [Granulicella arctica]